MDIKVFGTESKECNEFYENVKKVAKEINVNEVKIITEASELIKYQFEAVPVLVVNNYVISEGKLLSVEEITLLITTANTGCGGSCSSCHGCGH